MGTPQHEQLIRHESSDEFYIDEHSRRCPRCNDIKQLWAFRPESGKPVLNSQITPFCNVCRAAIKEDDRRNDRELKTAAALNRSTDAVHELGRMLQNVGKRRVLQEAAPSLVDGAKRLVDRKGGVDKFWNTIGEAVDSTIESDDPEIRLRAVNTLVAIVRDANKLQGEPVDLSTISDEDLMMLLREPAKRLLLENGDFRRELLEDPEVRRVFQSDLGIEVIEAEVVAGGAG